MDLWQQQQLSNDARQHELADRHEEQQQQLFDDSAEQQKYRYLDDRQNLHRMKRHPELQPFVPSDRFTSLSTGQPSLSSINKLNQQGGGSRTLSNQLKASHKTPLTTTPTSTGSDAFGQPKRYCSMTRLNQLAKPKMRPANKVQNVASAATLSTNSSNRSINSINKTLDKQRESKLLSAKEQKQPRPKHRDGKQANTSMPQSQQQQPKRPAETAAQKALTRKSLETQQQKQTPKLQQQKQKQSQRKLSDRPPITPITSVKPPTIMNTPLSPTTVMTTQTPQSSTPVVVREAKTSAGTRPSITPAVQLPTPASSLEEELESATKSNRNDITRDIVIEPSINEQMSEMSLNDPFYQSAASELVPESENSTNGINYDRNAESLCRELQEDLFANGFISHIDQDEFKSPVSNGRDNSLRRTSAATIVTSENLAQSETSQQISEDDDRRLRIERELRDKARQEDDDRRKREEIVENILSRFSQGSVS